MRFTRAAALAGAAVIFVLVATANSGGYRYGISDQAFYEPSISLRLDTALFPRDRILIESEARLSVLDEIFAALARVTNSNLRNLFLALYLMSLVLLFGAAMAFARSLGFSWWATSLLVTALTLRHRITRTGANTLEGYMHPRQIAFALGVAAIVAFVRNRPLWGLIWTAVAMAVHPTTGFWFAILLVPAVFIARPAWRRLIGAGLVVGGIAAGWAFTAGPLGHRLVEMDAPWLAVLAEKDYLFPTEWPLDAWAINLIGYPVLIWFIFRQRQAARVTIRNEEALLAGVAALLAVFILSVPLTALHVALAVQLQVTRVFWLMDFIAVTYVAWWLTSSPWWERTVGIRRAGIASVVVLATFALLRGFYIIEVEQRDRNLFQKGLPDTPWVDAMQWIERQPAVWYVLAHPGHAWKYGLSVRVAGRRDTLVESVKDSAIALYDRAIALRVAERLEAVAAFDSIDTAAARALGGKFDLNVLVVERGKTLDLPVLYSNDQFVVYDLK